MVQVSRARGGFKGRLTVWETVQSILSASGEATMVDLHRGYKEHLAAAYAEEWARFSGGRRPYRVVAGRRVYLRRPPRGMSYSSFTRYINRFVNEGKLEKVIIRGKVKTGEERYVADELLDIIKKPVYYRLA